MMQIQRKNSNRIIDKLVLWAGCTLLFISLALPLTSAYPVCYGNIDVIFVVDASYSIEDPDFTLVCEYVAQMYGDILGDVREQLRAGYIMYGSEVYENQIITLDEYSSSTFVPTLKTYTRDSGNIRTNTGLALERALAMHIADNRADTISFVVLITDGQSDDQATAYAAASQLKNRGVFIIAVGLGTLETINLNELQTLASTLDKAVVRGKDEMNDELLYITKKMVCGETLDKKTDPQVPQDSVAMDIYFLIDESQNVLSFDFEILKDFITGILETFVINNNMARVGLIKFGARSLGGSNHITLGQYSTEEDLFAAIANLDLNNFNSAGRSVIDAFSRLESDIAANSETDRPVVIVLVTTGLADGGEAAIVRAQAIQADTPPNKFLLVLGVGTDSTEWDSERNQMAFDVGTVYHADNFLALSGNDEASVTFINDVRNTIYELGTETYQPSGPGVPPKQSSNADIMFLIDGSSRVQAAVHFAIFKFVVKDLIDQLELGPDAAQIGVMIYDAAGWYNLIPFNGYTDRDDLYSQIDKLQLIQRTDYADNAVGLAAMRQYFQANSREPAAQIGYLITTSASQNALLAEAEAKALAHDGVQLIVLGVGDEVNEAELNNLEVFEGSGGPVTITTLPSVASTEVLDEMKGYIKTYAEINRAQGLYFPWEGGFDLIIMLHDDSGYVDRGSSAKNFLIDIYQRYQIGPDNVRVGVITFGADVNSAILLGVDNFLGSLVVKTLNLDLTPTGGVNVVGAMDAMMDMFSTYGRGTVPKLALLIMNGDVTLDVDLTDKVQEVKDAGIYMATVGVGLETNSVDMETMAYNEELAFMMDGWNRMDMSTLMDANLVALSRNQFEPSQGLANILRLPSLCSMPAGIVYLIDSSASMTDILDDAKTFAVALMSGFEMPTVQQGALYFGTVVIEDSVIELDDFTTYVELYINFERQVIQNFLSQQTGTFYALDRAMDMYAAVSPPIQEKVVIVLTDGKSDNQAETREVAELARAQGLQLVAIGVGNNILVEELVDITGDIDLVFLFQEADLAEVSKLQLVQETICRLTRPGNCLAGSYRNPDTMECLLCAQGSYQTDPEQLFCYPCPAGQTTDTTGSVLDSSCKDLCPAGTFDNGASCEPCALGYYQPDVNQGSCIDCPDTSPITDFTEATSIDDCKNDKCSVDMDLVLIVDCTASIGQYFGVLKLFLLNQLGYFQIPPMRIAIVRIGEETTVSDYTLLSQSTDETFLSNTIRGLVGGAAITNTASAIEVAVMILDTESVGTRELVPKIIFIVTDGNSYQPFETKYEALLAKEKGYHISVLGIGQGFMNELESIASDKDRVLREPNFALLSALDISGEICQAADEWVPPTNVVEGACDLAMDIVIMLDFSKESFFRPISAVKFILKPFIDSLPLGEDKVRIGIVSYGSQVNTDKILQFSTDPDDIWNLNENSLLSQPEDQTGIDTTETGQALRATYDLLMGDQPGRLKAIVALIGAESADRTETIEETAKIQEAGIMTVIAAVRNSSFIDELRSIADTGTNSLVLLDNALQLTALALEEKVCPENFACAYQLHLTYVWFLGNSVEIALKTNSFAKDLSDRFANVEASIIVIGENGILDMVDAIQRGRSQMAQDTLNTDTIHNIVIITDKLVSDIGDADTITAFATEVDEAKINGVKITIINAGIDTIWADYASDPEFAFMETDFDENLPSWQIQRSLCHEPCVSGSEVKSTGECGLCDTGTYRDVTDMYMCEPCQADRTTEGEGATSAAECSLSTQCDVPMDLIFAIDTTTSLSDLDIGRLKGFLWSLTNWFPIGQGTSETRVGIVPIRESFTSDEVMLLTESLDDIAVQLNIYDLEAVDESADYAAAIEKSSEIFSSEGRSKRAYPHILVLVTDEESSTTFHTKRQAAIAQLNGVAVMAITLGSNVDMSEIQDITSDPAYVHEFTDVDDLLASDYLHDSICEAARNYDFETAGPDPGDTLMGECKANMDIVFLLDCSNSVSDTDFVHLEIFMMQFAALLDIGQEKIRIGVIGFSQDVHTEDIFGLTDSKDYMTLLNGGILPQKKGDQPGTNTADAFAAMIDMFDTQGRDNSPYIAVVITDGASSDPADTATQAQNAKNQGIHVVTIGYGSSSTFFRDELYAMATDTASVKLINTFNDLSTKMLLDLACAYDFTCEHKMDIIALWDLEKFDTITRAQNFVDDLEESFPGSVIENVYVDHVADVAVAMQQTRVQLEAHTDTQATRIFVIITDKLLSAPVKASLQIEATAAKENGIIVAMLDALETNNIADADIASNTKLALSTHMFDVLPFSLVIKRSLCIEACSSGYEIDETTKCVECELNEYRDDTETFMCVACPDGRITTEIASTSLDHCLNGVCLSPMDIIFVIDSSGSIQIRDFQLLKTFIYNTVSPMDIGPDHTRVGLMVYGLDVDLSSVFDLVSSTTRDRVLTHILGLPYRPSQGTDTDKAIQVANTMMLTQARESATRTIVVITDGRSKNTYKTGEAAEKAQESFIRMFAVGVGANIFLDELNKIKSDEFSLITYDDFLDLGRVDNFLDLLCEDEFSCTLPMDLTLIEDDTPASAADSDYVIRKDNFYTRMAASYPSVARTSYFDLASLNAILTDGLTDITNTPENTKVYLFVVNSDITDPTVKANVDALKEAGGIAAIINANDAVDRSNFITIASREQLIFETATFDEMPAYRAIERKMCISPCVDGSERSMEGECTLCTEGSYRTATLTHTCVDCTVGRTTRDPGAVSDLFCIPDCGPGTRTVGDVCELCDVGFYQPDSFEFDCDQCATDYTTVDEGSMSVDDCKRDCGPGFYRSADETTCEPCEVNTYQPEALQTECVECPTNLITIATQSTSLNQCIDECGDPMDIVFVVDASDTVTSLEFFLIKNFVSTSINRFKVGSSDTRIGIVQYSDFAANNPLLNIADTTDREDAKLFANGLAQGSLPGVNLADGMQQGRLMLEAEGRSSVPKSMVVVSARESDDVAAAQGEATLAHTSSIQIVAVGVDGHSNEEELRSLATTSSMYLSAPSFLTLTTVDILEECCDALFTCDEEMNIMYSKFYDPDVVLDTQVTSFLMQLSVKSPASTIIEVSDISNLPVLAETDQTSIILLFTDISPTSVPAAETLADSWKEAGHIVSVIYMNDIPVSSYDNVVSNPELLFFETSFDSTPFSDFAIRSLCIAPCVDGEERGSDGKCTLCEKGTYRTAVNSHVCESCDPGETTPETGATRESQCESSVCTATQWECDRGDCIDLDQYCDDNVDCPFDDSDEDCNKCPPGTFWDGNSCEDCERGTYQPESRQTECIPCSEGTTTPGEATVLEADCNVVCDEDGQEVDISTGQCVDCPLGYYRNKNLHTRCAQCRDGFTTEQTASVIENQCVPDCDLGEYWSEVDGICLDCPVNTYQDVEYQSECNACPDGTTTGTLTGATRESRCNSICDDGWYLPADMTDDTECVQCPLGTYKADPDTTCQPCEEGFTTQFTESTIIDDCVPDCGLGEYYDLVEADCQTCAFGTYQDELYQYTCKLCTDGTTTLQQGSVQSDQCIVPCVAGEYLPPAGGDCTPCEVGYYRPDDNTQVTCIQCPDGYTTNDVGSPDVSSCLLDCLPGSRIFGVICQLCDVGTYQSEPRQTFCEPCETHLSTLANGANSVDLCIDPCASGEELSVQSPVACTNCPVNTYRDRDEDLFCVACPTLHITLSDEATSSELCIPNCLAGRRYDAVGVQCVDCELNTFQPQPYEDECIPCRDNWITPTIGSVNIDACIPDCPIGSSWVDSPTNACVPCDLDEYQPQPYQLECLSCPEGTVNTPGGAEQCADVCILGYELTPATVADCVPCPVGSYRDATTFVCLLCPDGFTTETDASTDSSDCIPDCTAGFYYEISLGVCNACPLSFYQANPYSTSCDPCTPAGYITLNYGADALEDCVPPCEAGYAWTAGQCEPCPLGEYQDLPNQDSCKVCTSPLTTLTPGATECVDPDPDCNAGEYKCDDGTCVTGVPCDGVVQCLTDSSDESVARCCVLGQFLNDQDTCEDCPIGSYQDSLGQTSCITCLDGKYTDFIQSTASTDCKECNAGYEFIFGNTACTECPLDTIRTLGMAECQECPDNFITTATASDSISACKPDCAAGRYFDGSTCQLCPAGTYQELYYQTSCDPCPQGQTTVSPQTGATSINVCEDICTDGYTLVYDGTGLATDQCEACDIGEVKVTAVSSVCQACPAGFTTTTVASVQCLPDCIVGTYYVNIASPVCTPCPRSQYQPLTLQDSCLDCPLGLTTLTIGADTLALCYDPCSSGYEYNVLTDMCNVCIEGSYKTKNVHGECQPCHDDFTTLENAAKSSDECVPPCVAGEFYDEDIKRCQLCARGWYQPDANQYVCLRCPTGTTTQATGALECEDICGAGYELHTNGQRCVECEEGTVKLPGETVCTQCQESFTTDDSVAPEDRVCVPNCEPGFYWDDTKCAVCAKGSYQPDPYQYICIACVNGLTTVDFGAIDVLECIDICPSGFELAYTGICMACPLNYYRVQGENAQCVACPGDFVTFFVGADSINECFPLCDAGYNWDSSTDQCEPCAAGSYQELENQLTCDLCTTGMTTIDQTGAVTGPVTGATSALQCVGDCMEGTYWDVTLESCEPCAKGSYQDFRYRDICVECSPGYTTLTIGTIEVKYCFDPCLSGFTYDADLNECIPCGFHMYRDRAIHNQCLPCTPPHITLVETATSEAQCVSWCPAGEEWNEALYVCEECQIGYYQPDGHQTECIRCADDWTTASTGTVLATDCISPCGVGEEWDAVGTECVYCPVGTYQDTPNQLTCIACAVGKSTFTQGSTAATDCVDSACSPPNEWVCSNGIGCGARCSASLNCADLSDEAGCNCVAGQFYSVADGVCYPCIDGQYQDLSGQFTCKLCPTGYTSSAGSNSINDCIDACNAGWELNLLTMLCEQCAFGTYRPVDQVGGCIDCPDSYTTLLPGAEDATECLPDCSEGEFFDILVLACTPCPVGQYQNLPNKFTCENCPAGETTLVAGATDILQCDDVCGGGQELPVGGVVVADCVPCPIGSYKNPADSAQCITCPAGFTTAFVGASTAAQCIPDCVPGERITPAGDDCQECARGSYQTAPLAFTCIPCIDGTTTLFAGADDPDLCDDFCSSGLELSADLLSCEPCALGFYRTQYDQVQCVACPAGLTTATIGAATVDACVFNCVAGSFYDAVSASCKLCPVGSYQDLPHQTSCDDCPAWTTTLDVGTDTFDGCIDPCVSGYEKDGDSCVECLRGWYRTQDIHPECQGCRDGFTTLATASISELDCIPACGPGTYFEEATDRCTNCAEGWFNPDAYQTECQQCPANKPLSDNAYTMCKDDCPAGEAWNRARQICNWCARGTYKDVDGTTCLACPDGGRTDNVGSTSITDCYNVNCPPGKYLVGQQCNLCPAGTYKTGTNTDTCQSCPLGRESAADRASCDPCGVGRYRGSSDGITCKSCPTSRPATYIIIATSSSQCTRNCGPGFRINAAAGTCDICTTVQYQDEVNQLTCKECPNNFHTMDPGSTDVNDCQANWCDPGYTYNHTTEDCDPCGLGYYRTHTDIDCLQCPNGLITYSHHAGNISECTAVACGPGSRINGETGTCDECTTMEYQDEVNQATCKICPNNYHTMETGSTDVSDCQADWCDAGYQYNTHTLACDPCGYGYYRTVADVGCKSCPASLTTSTNHATSNSQCIFMIDPCSDGYEVVDGRCRKCPIGFYKDATCAGHCLRCPDGYTTVDRASTSLSECRDDLCSRNFDLVIVLDLSNSASTSEREALCNYTRHLAERFAIDRDAVRIGIVKYARGSREVISIEDGCSYSRVQERIHNDLAFSSANEVNTAAGLRRACQMFTDAGSPYSGNTPRVLLITDQSSDDVSATKFESNRLKMKGVELTVIGTDPEEVSTLASTEDDEFLIADYNDLPPLDDVVDALCEETP